MKLQRVDSRQQGPNRPGARGRWWNIGSWIWLVVFGTLGVGVLLLNDDQGLLSY